MNHLRVNRVRFNTSLLIIRQFAGESLTDKDRLNYMNTIKDMVLENQKVVQQLENNTPDQVMTGDYPNAVQDAVMDSLQTHNDLASQLLQNKTVSKEFARLLLDVILREQVAHKDASPTPQTDRRRGP